MRPTLVIASLSLACALAPSADAAVSATVVPGSFTQGTVQASLGAGTTYANASVALNDWWTSTSNLATAGTKYAISLTNGNYNQPLNNNSTVLAFGNGGGLTLKFDQTIHPVAGQKEFGLFTAQFLNASTGGSFSGNMEAAVLVSSDGVNFVTLAGAPVATPASYTTTSSRLNAPSSGFNFGAITTASTYGFPGTTRENLLALPAADYTQPMPNDNAFNGAGTDADRLALFGDSTGTTYNATFGTSGGGNWFDLSSTGLTDVNYVRLNGVNNNGGVRLDAVYANPAAVPEPATLGLIAVGSLLALRRRTRRNAVAACAGLGLMSATNANAQSLDSIGFWAGSGSNRAAMAVYWRSPTVRNNTSVPNPIVERTMLWGIRFNGTLNGEQAFNAIVAADPKLYALDSGPSSFGSAVLGIGYDLNANGQYGLTDGTNTYNQSTFAAHRRSTTFAGADTLTPTDSGDLYWGGGLGPSWELWTEHNNTGGYYDGVNRGTVPYFTPDNGFGGTHGQWDLATNGLSSVTLTNGSWLGLSVAAGGFDYFNPDSAGTVAYNTLKAAPQTVPEPAALVVVGVSGFGILRRRR